VRVKPCRTREGVDLMWRPCIYTCYNSCGSGGNGVLENRGIRQRQPYADTFSSTEEEATKLQGRGECLGPSPCAPTMLHSKPLISCVSGMGI
jgi:hypothetical protein